MKLQRVLVQNYRSIVDSGSVNIEEGVTVLIGKNEQGKTNFLKALTSFNPDKTYSPSDLPNHLRPSLEGMSRQEIPILTLWLGLESQDKAKLKGIIENVEAIYQLKCTRNYGNDYAYCAVMPGGIEQELRIARPDTAVEAAKIKITAGDLKQKLDTHGERLPPFAATKDQVAQIVGALVSADYSNVGQLGDVIRAFSTAVKGLPAQDQAVQEEIGAATRQIEGHYTNLLVLSQADNLKILRESLPTFIYHTTKTDQIPNKVNIAQFVGNPEGTSKGMLNLCRAAGLSIQKISELAATTDTSHRESYEDFYKSQISGGINEYWTQEKYLVHFRFEGREELSVSISDDTYSPRVAPSDRSEGFQWYLSFYSSVLNEVGDPNRVILLLDNPALELHVDGQRDIKRFLEEKIAFTSQVIYVTHSPAMIDPFNLAQLRKVVLLRDQEGTKILASVSKEGDDFDLLEPVRAAIGMSLVASLAVNDFNLLVEGAADKPILEGAFGLFATECSRKVLVNGSLAESKDALLARFYARTRLPLVNFLDADSGGRQLEAELKKWQIPETQIIKLDTVFPDREGDFATEDILSDEFYHTAFTDAYPGHHMDRPKRTAKKLASSYEEALKEQHGIGFNKRRVAESAKRLLLQDKADTTTRENLKKVTDAIVDKFRTQTQLPGALPGRADKQVESDSGGQVGVA